MKSIDLDRLYDYLHGIGGCDASDDWSKGWDDDIVAWAELPEPYCGKE